MKVCKKHGFTEYVYSVKAIEEWCVRNGLPRKRKDLILYIKNIQ